MNNENIQVLLKNIEDTSRLVLFAGAGISVGAGYPLWVRATEMALDSSLKRGLSTAAGGYAREKLQKGSYYDVFQILQDEMTEPGFYKIAEEVFGGDNADSEIE